MVGRQRAPTCRRSDPRVDGGDGRRCRCAASALARPRPRRAARRRRPRACAAASWWASPASPATASSSCTRWPWACATPTSGTVERRRPSCSTANPGGALAAGAVGVPEDPVPDSVVPGLSRAPPRRPRRCSTRSASAWASTGARCATATGRAQRGAASCARSTASATLATLSGGNIQRVMLVRALAGDAKLVVAAYPSRGLDIATTRRTQELLLEQRAGGAGVLLISEDLDELFDMSDRIAVLHGGHVVGVVDPRTPTATTIGRLMLGHRRDVDDDERGVDGSSRHERDHRASRRRTEPAPRPSRRGRPRPSWSPGCGGPAGAARRVRRRARPLRRRHRCSRASTRRRPTRTWSRSTFTGWDSIGEILVRAHADHPRRTGRRPCRPGPG